MTKQVEFFFDFGSPASYLAYLQLPKIAAKTGGEIVYRPFLLGGVFKTTGNSSPMAVPAKGAWMGRDLERYANRYGVELKFNPHFPINTVQLMRGAVWAKEEGTLESYATAVFKAVWAEEKNMGDPEVVAKVLETAGVDPVEFSEAVANQEIKDKLRSATDEAVQRGAFGAPTMFVGDDMFWGQDRLDFVEEALSS
ncbi:MAG: 2-hydroxychromene-2-carboxylate isomerase [Proteobacteria bacterium]|nr:2-hydroxychromene-2-carboxylate isomerase [Pseudomonadota bacterium]